MAEEPMKTETFRLDMRKRRVGPLDNGPDSLPDRNEIATEDLNTCLVNNETPTEHGLDGKVHEHSDSEPMVGIKEMAKAGNVQELIEALDTFWSQLGDLFPERTFLHYLTEKPESVLKNSFGTL